MRPFIGGRPPRASRRRRLTVGGYCRSHQRARNPKQPSALGVVQSADNVATPPAARPRPAAAAVDACGDDRAAAPPRSTESRSPGSASGIWTTAAAAPARSTRANATTRLSRDLVRVARSRTASTRRPAPSTRPPAQKYRQRRVARRQSGAARVPGPYMTACNAPRRNLGELDSPADLVEVPQTPNTTRGRRGPTTSCTGGHYRA